jgi:tetratricopeptide (TPR) repeat protein
MWHLNRVSQSDFTEARRWFGKAIDNAPDFALPYAGLSYLSCLEVALGWTNTSSDRLGEAFRAGQRAAELDDREAFAHFALGRVCSMRGDHSRAVAEQQIAIALNPSFAHGYYGLGYALCRVGRADEALRNHNLAIRLSPRDTLVYMFLHQKGQCHYLLGQYEEAIESERKALSKNPTQVFWPQVILAASYARQGEYQKARTAVDELCRLKPGATSSTINEIYPGMDSDYLADILDGLRKAGLPE